MTAAAPIIIDDERGPEAPTNPRLWIAVVTQALRDGVDCGQSAKARVTRDHARAWFRQKHPASDFRFVCDRAELDHEWVAERAERLFAKADRGETIARAHMAKEPAKQRRVRRPSTALYTANGKTMTLAEWSAATGIPVATLQSRLGHLRWPIERALTEPPRTEALRQKRLSALSHSQPPVGQNFLEPQGTGGGSRPRDENENGSFVENG